VLARGRDWRWLWGLLLVLVALVVVALVVGVGAWQRAGNPVAMAPPPGGTDYPVDGLVDPRVLGTKGELEAGPGFPGEPQAYAMPPGTGWSHTRQWYQKALGAGWRATGDCDTAKVPGEYRCRWVERTRLWPRSVELVMLCPPAVNYYITVVVAESPGR
jgi:hypothetical protein